MSARQHYRLYAVGRRVCALLEAEEPAGALHESVREGWKKLVGSWQLMVWRGV